MRRFGWLVRIRTSAECLPFGWIAATEGFPRKFGHPDLEIVLPMPSERAHAILCCAAEMISTGATFWAGKKMADVLANGFDVEFVHSHEGTSRRLRLILPDGHNQTERHLMTGKTARQWEVVSSYVPPEEEPPRKKPRRAKK